jgi:hypothetical protein
MNTAAIATIAAELAKLTPQEHLIASELAQRLRVDKPSPLVETPRRKQNPKRWGKSETAIAILLAEDTSIMSPQSQRNKIAETAESLGRTYDSVYQKILKLRKATQ